MKKKTVTLDELLKDKTKKAKVKMAQIGNWLLNGELTMGLLLAFAETQDGTNKATCIEAIEYATKKAPGIGTESLLIFVTKTLKEDEPRIKWESAKVIANIAKLFPEHLTKPISSLLVNAEHSGTVVRWATAQALAEILKLNTNQSKKLLPKIELLCKKERDSGVRKKYLDALKKVNK